ncbi:MAG: outer membrane beta-barrel protein [Nitrospira sp.]|nr:outer membrane beta-barrel protein [Nitrospira sp.]
MNMISTAIRWFEISVVVVACVAAANVPRSYAETYIAGQFGVTLPSIAGNGLSGGELTSTGATFSTGTVNLPSGSTVSDQSLKESFMFGGKIGHYFSRARWFGIEAEVFYSQPHLKQQDITWHSETQFTFTPSGGGPSVPLGNDFTFTNVPGVNFRVLTIAPLNLMFRYPGTRLQPYIGFGPGIFMARINDPSITQGDSSQSSTKFGLNALAGLRYYFTRHMSIFAEGKFNYVRFSFEENSNFFGFDATYMPIHASGGLSVHF